MQKVNFDAKRAQILKQIHAEKVKTALKAKKDAERLANQAPVLDEVINQQLDALAEQNERILNEENVEVAIDIGIRVDMIMADDQVVVDESQAA